MLTRKLLSVALWLMVAGVMALAQVHTPKAGSRERQALMDALRVPVEKELGKSVVFKVGRLKVQDGWAFLTAVPKQPNGKAMDYRGTPFYKAYQDGMFSDFVCALFGKRGEKWQVVTYSLGPTDVPYVDWSARYKAPAAIFK